MDTITRTDDAENSGYEKRKQIASAGRTFELYGHLHCDLFN